MRAKKLRKILFFLSNLNGGGAQRTIVNIINGLNRQRFEIKLVVLDLNKSHPYYNLVSHDVPIININRRGRYSIPRIINILNKEKPDVIVSTLIQVNLAVAIAHKISKSNAKLILRETTHRTRSDFNIINYKLTKWAYNYCDAIIALSQGVSRDISNLYGVEQENICVIYNPIDVNYIIRKSNESVELPKSSSFKLIACGRLEKEKNFSLLLEALGEMSRKYSDWTLYILGEGSEKENLSKLAQQLNISDKVFFLGFKKNPYKYMKNSDLFILSSKKEGFGHVIVESMATGTPVLASNCPYGPYEILKNNYYGWLFKNNHKMDLVKKLKVLYENKNVLKEMEYKIKSRVMDFDKGNIIKEYEQIFCD